MMQRILGVVLTVSLPLTATLTAVGSPPVLQVDDESFFPLGWYTSSTFSTVAEATQYLTVMRNHGMNTALTCYYANSPSCSTYMARLLEAAAACDMKIIAENIRCSVRGEPECPLSWIDDQVDALKDYPALLGWYLIDEPEFQGPGTTPEILPLRYQQVKDRDTVGHPIFVVHAAYGPSVRAAPDYLAAGTYCDVLMTDTYPISEGTYEFSRPLWWVATESRIHTQLAIAYDLQAYINIPQAHGQCFGLRIPTAPEQRYLSYAPIVEGARGLLWWMHNAYTTEGHRDKDIPSIAHEIQSLVSAIISNSTAVSVSSNRDTDTTGNGIEDVTYLFGADRSNGYLIAVNNTPNSFSVTFQLSGSILADVLEPASTSIPVVFEQRDVLIEPTGDPSTRILNDNCSPYDVNVYRIYEIINNDTPAGPPAQVTKPHPANDSTSVGRTFDLNWTPSDEATSYDVYFGTTNPPPFQGNQASTHFDPGTMPYETPHFWRIDAVNAHGTTTGDVWTFTTVGPNFPGKASEPDPPNLAEYVYVGAQLGWKEGASARSYDVYFGTAEPPAFQVNQAELTFNPGMMDESTTYFWRIDSVNDDGKTTGDVWSFTTGSSKVHIDLGTINDEHGVAAYTPPDGDTQPASQGGRDCRTIVDTDDCCMYFNVDDLWRINHAGGMFWITMDFFDSAGCSGDAIRLEYDQVGGSAEALHPDYPILSGDDTWKRYTWQLTDANFQNRQDDVADFRINRGTVPYDKFFLDVVSVFTSAISVDMNIGEDLENGLRQVKCFDQTARVTQGGRQCARNDPNSLYVSFKVSDGWAFDGSKPEVWITVDTYDYPELAGFELILQYDSLDTSLPYPWYMYKTAGPSNLHMGGPAGWVRHTWHITDARFANRQNCDADFRIHLMNTTGTTYFYLDMVSISVGQAPYPDPATPFIIPNDQVVRLEAENYDLGGQSVAYFDTTGGNQGGSYRSESVDVQTCTEGGYNVALTVTGEWLEYTVNVATSDTYEIKLRVASPNGGTNKFHIEMNGTNVTGPQSIPATGDWQTWTTKTVSGVYLNAGEQVLRLYMDGGDWNLNWMEFERYCAVPSITQHPADQEAKPGADVQFTVTASGMGSLSYQWKKNDNNLSNGGNISGVDTPTLEIADAGEGDEGNYCCEVSNECGSVVSNEARLTVRYAADFDDDGDVDQEDFGYFQGCLSGSGLSYGQGCKNADFNSDNDVDQDDFAVFQSCLSGTNKPPRC